MNSAERFSSSLNFTSGLLYYEVIGFLACRRKVCQAKALLSSGSLLRTIGVDDPNDKSNRDHLHAAGLPLVRGGEGRDSCFGLRRRVLTGRGKHRRRAGASRAIRL